METFRKNTKAGGADKCKRYVKTVSKMSPKSVKLDHGAQQKTMFENKPQEIKKCLNMTPKSIPKNDTFSGGGASWGNFGGPTRF